MGVRRLSRGRKVAVVAVLAVVALVGAGLGGVALLASREASAVAEVHRAVQAAPLPAGLEHDPTLTPCGVETWIPARCVWSDRAPEEAAALLASTLRDAGVAVEDGPCPVAEDGPPATSSTVCVGSVAAAGHTLRVLAGATTDDDGVPLGQTWAAAVWESGTFDESLLGRLQGDLPHTGGVAQSEAELDEALGLLPARYRSVPCDEEPCTYREGEVDVPGTEVTEAVEAVVAELAEARFLLTAVEEDEGTTVVHASRYRSADAELPVMVRVEVSEVGARARLVLH